MSVLQGGDQGVFWCVRALVCEGDTITMTAHRRNAFNVNMVIYPDHYQKRLDFGHTYFPNGGTTLIFRFRRDKWKWRIQDIFVDAFSMYLKSKPTPNQLPR